jgi:hypothetical protein
MTRDLQCAGCALVGPGVSRVTWLGPPRTLCGSCIEEASAKRDSRGSSSANGNEPRVRTREASSPNTSTPAPQSPNAGPRPRPGTGGGNNDESEPQIRELLRLYREQEIAPVPVELGPLAIDALPVDVEAAAMLQLRFGLRLADGTDDLMMCATSELVSEGIVPTKGGASRVLHRLEDTGVIWSPGSMEPLGKGNGTRLFLPGPRPIGPWPEGGWVDDEGKPRDPLARVRSALDGVPRAVLERGAVPVEAQHVAAGVPFEPLPEAPNEARVGSAVRRRAAGNLDRVRTPARGAPPPGAGALVGASHCSQEVVHDVDRNPDTRQER